MDAATSAALVSTIPARNHALTGLIRRFNDERNQPAAQAAQALHEYILQEAIQHLQQLDNTSETPEYFAEIRRRAHDAVATVTTPRAPTAATPESPADTPPDSWHLPYLKILADTAAIQSASDAAVRLWARGREELALYYANAVHALAQHCISQNEQIARRRHPNPRPKGSNRSLHNQTIGASDQQHQAHLKIHHICRRYMNVVVCPALAMENPDHDIILDQAEIMRNNPVDVVTAQMRTYNPNTGETHDHELVYFEYDDAIHVKTVEENFPTGYPYADLHLHTQAIRQNTRNIIRAGTHEAGQRASYLHNATSWTLRFYYANIHDVHQLDIHRLLMEILATGYTLNFINKTVLPIITNNDLPLAELLTNQTGFNKTPKVDHEPTAVASEPRDQIIRTAFSIGLPYAAVVKLAELIPADHRAIWHDVRHLVRPPIRLRNEQYLANS